MILMHGTVKQDYIGLGRIKWIYFYKILGFLLLTLIFTIFKEKSVMLISGFNTMPKEKRELYDKEKLSKDYRNIGKGIPPTWVPPPSSRRSLQVPKAQPIAPSILISSSSYIQPGIFQMESN